MKLGNFIVVEFFFFFFNLRIELTNINIHIKNNFIFIIKHLSLCKLSY
jgi:hypothetical protein